MSFSESKSIAKVSKAQRVSKTDLINANKLDYNMPRFLTSVTTRQLVTHYASQQTYGSGKTISLTINSGDNFVMGKTSYLQFSVAVTGVQATTWGKGSAMNIFDSLNIVHSSGVQVERLENLNLYHASTTRYKHTGSYVDTVGSMFDMDQTYAPRTNPIEANLTGNIVNYVIPLGELSGLFASDSNLLPPYLMSGARLELGLARPATALVAAAADLTVDYTISNVELVLDSITMGDATSKMINKMSAEQGVVLSWNSHNVVSLSGLNSTSLNISESLAMSRANGVVVITRTQDDTENEEKDSMVCRPYDLVEYGFRLGSNDFPSKPVKNATQGYHNALYSFSKVGNDPAVSSVTYDDFKNEGGGILSATMERNQALDFSSLPVSGSRQLTCNAVYGTGGVNRQISMMTDYTRILVLYLFDRAVIKF